jgi:hypothetical protein
MIDISPQSTCHTSINEDLSVDYTGNHYLQSPWYYRSPLFDLFCCFPLDGTTSDAKTSNGPPSRSEQLFEDELKGWDELSDESWLDFQA